MWLNCSLELKPCSKRSSKHFWLDENALQAFSCLNESVSSVLLAVRRISRYNWIILVFALAGLVCVRCVVDHFKLGRLQFAEKGLSPVWPSDMLIKVDFLKMVRAGWQAPPEWSQKPMSWQRCVSFIACFSLPVRTHWSLYEGICLKAIVLVWNNRRSSCSPPHPHSPISPEINITVLRPPTMRPFQLSVFKGCTFVIPKWAQNVPNQPQSYEFPKISLFSHYQPFLGCCCTLCCKPDSNFELWGNCRDNIRSKTHKYQLKSLTWSMEWMSDEKVNQSWIWRGAVNVIDLALKKVHITHKYYCVPGWLSNFFILVYFLTFPIWFVFMPFFFFIINVDE